MWWKCTKWQKHAYQKVCNIDTSLLRWECFFFVDFILKQANIIGSFFGNNYDNDEFTLWDAVLFSSKKQKNRLEHAYAVTAWALSLQPDIWADFIEQLVLTMEISGRWWMRWFHGFIMLHVQTRKLWKSIDEIIDIFWKDFKHFTYRTGPYSYHSCCFENGNALYGWSHLRHEMHSLLFTGVLGFVACWIT